MKRLGHKKTRTRVKGHQDCGVCHPDVKNRKAKEKRRVATEAQAEAVGVRVCRNVDLIDPEEHARAQLLDIGGIPGSVLDDVAESMIEQERERRGGK